MRRSIFALSAIAIISITAACSQAPDDSVIESAVRNSLKEEVSPLVIGNMLGGINGQLEEFEVLSKSYNKGEPNAVFKAFGAKPEPYWLIEVRIKGTAQIGVDKRTAALLGSGRPETKSFHSHASYRLYQADDGSWYAKWQ